ncbi:hypothetical protein Tco_1058861 [Tanacetum coccineum]
MDITKADQIALDDALVAPAKRLKIAQIIWGMYNNKKVNYAYLLWEDFTYQIENKDTKKANVIDDPMFTTINVISRNEDTQLYGGILPKELTNEEIRKSESYKEYYAIASGEVPPKTKASAPKKKVNPDTSTKQKSPTDPKDTRVKQTGKKTGAGKQKQPAGLETLFDTALTEIEQLKIVTKRSQIQTRSSHASGSGADEGTGVTPGVPDVPNYDSDDVIS